jgi:hypothetical protein
MINDRTAESIRIDLLRNASLQKTQAEKSSESSSQHAYSYLLIDGDDLPGVRERR